MPKKRKYLIGQVGASFESMFFGGDFFTLRDVIEHVEANQGEEIEFYLHSEGGSVTEGFAIANYIENSPENITIIATRAESMGLPILASAKQGKRHATSEAVIMLHLPAYSNLPNADENDIEEALENIKQAKQKIAGLLSRRTGREEAFWIEQLSASDNKITSTQALEFGLIDSIIQPIEEVVAMAASANRKFQAIQAFSNNPNNHFMSNMKALMQMFGSKPQLKGLELALETGENLTVSTEGNDYQVGDNVSIGGQAVEDGEYTLLEGSRILTIVGSKISAINEKDPKEEGIGEEVDNENEPMELMAAAIMNSSNQMQGLSELVSTMKAQMTAATGAMTEQAKVIAGLQQELLTLKADLENTKKMASSDYQPPVNLGNEEENVQTYQGGSTLQQKIAQALAEKNKQRTY